MAHVTFDTLKFIEKLKEAGVPEAQAKAFTEAQKEALSESLDDFLATKKDVYEVKEEISKVKAELVLLRWMLGFIIAGVASLVLKAFFVT